MSGGKQIKDSIEDEISHLGGSYQQLKLAQNRYSDCVQSLDELGQSSPDTDMLVPLTASLYVPGKLADIKKVVVDIGTGYYAEKSTQDARDLYERKVNYLKTNCDKLQETLIARQNNMKLIVEFMQFRMNEAKKAQEAQ